MKWTKDSCSGIKDTCNSLIDVFRYLLSRAFNFVIYIYIYIYATDYL